MAQPVSLKISPFTTNVLSKKRYLIIYFILMWVSFFPPIIEFWFYWRMFYINSPILFYFLLPLELLLVYLILVFSSIIFARLALIFVNLFHKPREGVFPRDPKNKDYNYWSLRSIIQKWAAWISHTFPIPWHDVILFKIMGVKTHFSNSTYGGYISLEFVELGKNVALGDGSSIFGSIIIGNYLIIKKIKIGDNVIISTHSVVMPGTIIGDNCILSAYSLTAVDQELEEGWIYMGTPVKKYKENKFLDMDLKILFDEKKDVSEKWTKFVEKRDALILKEKKKEI